jgi:hypothetical protein
MIEAVVTRTSHHGDMDEGPPCEGAYRSERARREWLVMELEQGCAHEWYGSGANHRKVNGSLVRDVGVEPCWRLRVETLGDLLAVAEAEKGRRARVVGYSVILSREEDEWVLEIYDDYRE